MFNKLSDGPEIAEGLLTEMQKRMQVSGQIAEKCYELQSRVSGLCYRFFGSFPVPVGAAANPKEGVGYLYDIDTNLNNTVSQLKELETFVERLEKL